MRTSVLLLAAAAAFAAFPAGAASTVNPDGSVSLAAADPFAFSVNYDGFAGSVIAGLTATIDFDFLGASNAGKTFNFDYVLTNTSSSPVLTSRVSIFGFDTSPDLAGASATGAFTIIGDGNVPSGFGPVELCFKSASSPNNCSGGGGGGVTLGNSGTGSFALTFASAPANVDLSRLFVRYQTLSSSESAQTSAMGRGTPFVNMVPEPATWAMMIGGFALVGGAVRSRRRTLATA